MKQQPRYNKGDKIGNRYQIHKALMGGMGEIYLCLDLKTMLPFALKTFQGRYLTNAPMLQRAFEKEVAVWVALEKHPNIVRCFHMSILDNQPFMFLEWITGEEGRGADLRSWLRHGPLDLQLALEIIIDICQGLIYAQEKQPGLVHRDLKPENILMAPGGIAKVTDFGLAQIVQEARLSVTVAPGENDVRHSMVVRQGIVGTPAYMAPELWRGEVVDSRTDIYAIGCVFYELLTGNHPFWATTLDGWQQQHLVEVIPKLSSDRAWSNSINSLLSSCLAKQPIHRFASVNNLLQELMHLYQQISNKTAPCKVMSGELSATDYKNRAATYSDLQLYDKALADFDRAIQLDPNHVPTFNNRGNTYTTLHRYDEALYDLNRAIQLDPNYAPAYVNRSHTYRILGRYEDALLDLSQAIQIDPTLAHAFANRGGIYMVMKQYEKALIDFNHAIVLDPFLVHVYDHLGNIYANLQRYEEALINHNRAIKLSPSDVRLYHNRGATYGEIGRYEEAIADFSKAIQLKPLMEAYFSRGVIFHKLQQYDEALSDYGQAIDLNPAFTPAYVNVGIILDEQGKPNEALPYLEKAVSLGDSKANYALILVKQKIKIQSMPQSNPHQKAFIALQEANSRADVQLLTTEFPFIADGAFIMVGLTMARMLPLERQTVTMRNLDWLHQIVTGQTDPFELAIEAFLEADTIDEMQQASINFPFMLDVDFAKTLEQIGKQNVPEKYRLSFDQRLIWLRQIAKDQRPGFSGRLFKRK